MEKRKVPKIEPWGLPTFRDWGNEEKGAEESEKGAVSEEGVRPEECPGNQGRQNFNDEGIVSLVKYS